MVKVIIGNTENIREFPQADTCVADASQNSLHVKQGTKVVAYFNLGSIVGYEIEED